VSSIKEKRINIFIYFLAGCISTKDGRVRKIMRKAYNLRNKDERRIGREIPVRGTI